MQASEREKLRRKAVDLSTTNFLEIVFMEFGLKRFGLLR